MYWERLREEEFAAAAEKTGGVCVIPLGCVEKHGQHLPVGTDYFEAVSIVGRASEREEVMIFSPGAWLGEVSCFHAFDDPGKMGLRGCIGIKQETVLTVMSELCGEIARNGFNKILFVNGHGGNSALLKHFLRCQTYEKHPYVALVTSAFAFGEIDPKRLYKRVMGERGRFDYLTEEDVETLRRFAESGAGGGHADIRETSLMLEFAPELVCEDRYLAESGESTHRTDYLTSLGVESPNCWLANFPNSYEAYPPTGASANIGRAMAEVCVLRLANIFKAVKEDGDVLNSSQMLPKM